MNFDVLDIFSEQDNEYKSEESAQGIAIIGIHAQIGNSQSAEEFWNGIVNGRDFICDFPSERWNDVDNICQIKYGEGLSGELAQEAYLDRIDLFDADYFNISPAEAKLMSPLQRLFLESAWTAIEDAGYGGDKMRGTNTGVYVGYTKAGTQYEEILEEEDGFGGIRVSGNVASIIASRISYLLDLRGPAMIVDTACSSSLVSVHLACRQLLDREIDMAIVGGIRVVLIPAEKNREHIGIESSFERTRTFDKSADGTGGGEGVISIVLKPLAQAQEDRDHIYAVVKGSSINQDGASVGITAPNVAAQEEVIVNAWKDARIAPEDISYIEAHGTATKLGDPIEIEGLNRAFSKYTNKKQFCSIGSVKTNTGHLDAAAGLAGLIKTIMMLKYKQIPSNLYFNSPNPEINFISSPLVVNDTLCEWDSCNKLRSCGINSFGISGTNCHVVLEETPELINSKDREYSKYKILTISALKKEQILQIVKKYQTFLIENPDIDFEDFCYTANTGRGHYACRLAVIIKNREEFLKVSFNEEKFTHLPDNWYYAEHIVRDTISEQEFGVITVEQQKNLSSKANLLINDIHRGIDEETILVKMKELLEIYIKGATPVWDSLYKMNPYNKISIPTYPFQHKRYWPDLNKRKLKKISSVVKKVLHPLVDECKANTYGLRIYESVISPETRWILKEHKINERYVLPGTAYVEMAHFVGQQIFNTNVFEINDVVFMNPLICEDKETRILNIISKICEDRVEITIVSRREEDSQWLCHAEMYIKDTEVQVPMTTLNGNFADIKSRCNKLNVDTMNDQDSIVKLSGLRWMNTKEIWCNNTEILERMELNEGLEDERKQFYLYPTLLDGAVNVGNVLTNGFYLPFSYKKAVFFREIPREFYSYLRKKTKGNSEMELFDVTLYDANGDVIGIIEDYALKQVKRPQHFITEHTLDQGIYYELTWHLQKDNTLLSLEKNRKILVILCSDCVKNREIILLLERQLGKKVVVAALKKAFFTMPETYIEINNIQEDFDKLMKILSECHITDIVYISNQNILSENVMPDVSDIQGIFLLTKAIIHANIKYDIQINILTKNAIEITGREKILNPLGYSLAQIGSCIEAEYDNIVVNSIDFDDETSSDIIVEKILKLNSRYSITAFRENQSYIQKMSHMQVNVKQEEIRLRDNGVYLIAGGFGGMGMTFAKALWENNPSITILLLNRSCDDNSKYAIVKRKSDKKQSEFLMWACDKDIHFIKVDISDENQMREVFDKLYQQYRRVDGVIQSAGIEGNGFIYRKEWETFEKVLLPKINGTWNLYQMTKQHDLQFFVMCSSISSVFGSAGQSDYTVANAYLDSFSYSLRRKGINSMTINWTGWSQSGMAYRNGVDAKSSIWEFLTDEEGAIVLEHILKFRNTRLLVGRINKEVYIQNKNDLERRVDMSEIKPDLESNSLEKKEPKITELTITGKSIYELTETEKQIIQIWVQTLDVYEVDVNKKFFESGGNSLLTAALHKGINNIYPGIMSITDIFVYSSVVEIADYIDSKIDKKKQKKFDVIEDSEENDDIDELLEKFINGDISKDDIEDLI